MIRKAIEKDIIELRDIYGKSFPGDDENFKDLFYKKIFHSSDTFVLISKNRIASMLTLMDVSLISKGKKYKGYYLYGAATDPLFRCCGNFRKLVDYALKYSADNKKDFIVTIPGFKELICFYEQLGFNSFINKYTAEYNEFSFGNYEDTKLKNISKDEFVNFRNGIIYCNPSPFDSGIIFLETNCLNSYMCDDILMTNGSFIKIENKYGQNYAVCYKIDNKLYIRETMPNIKVLEAAVYNLLQYFSADSLIADVFPFVNYNKCEIFGVCCILNSSMCINMRDVFMSSMFEFSTEI